LAQFSATKSSLTRMHYYCTDLINQVLEDYFLKSERTDIQPVHRHKISAVTSRWSWKG